MMRIVFFILCLLLCSSCASIQQIDENNIVGVFYCKKLSTKNKFGYEYTLNIEKENKFSMFQRFQDASPRCSGIWELKDGFLFLKCLDTESITDKLSNAYMNQRDFKINVKNKDKLELENHIILKRK
ncbi:MAG: hypothetical protein MUW56_21775 [Chryseobacterium sp.]|uniref:hypothetical protein n=1 Tax=Chryseobacterium sp. TaxID=1871047 RepID=UPI0025C604EF|nr:hypothetical protein [Chryseobacterium sp.]MCJ7936185.1 hypothetical protein [Chryseobacterium sp.]